MYSRCCWWLLATLWLTGCGRYIFIDVPEEELERTLQELHLEELAAGSGEVRRLTVVKDRYWLAPGSWWEYCVQFEPDDFELDVAYWSSHEWAREPYYSPGGENCPRWWPASGMTMISTVDTRRHESSTAHTHPVEIFGDHESLMLYFYTGQGH